MTLHELTRLFENHTWIVVSTTSKSDIYSGRIYNYSSEIDKEYLDKEVCSCRIIDNKLDILLDK